jgi:lipoprotein-anchoring transpeptidase ErfK/SrfK
MAGHRNKRVKSLLRAFALLALAPLGSLQAQGFSSVSGAPPAAPPAVIVAPSNAPAAPATVPAAVPDTVPANAPVAVPPAPSGIAPAGPPPSFPAANAARVENTAPLATVAYNSAAYNSGAFSSVSGNVPNVPVAPPPATDFGAGSSGGFEMAEKVLVDKSERKLVLLRRGRVIKEYPIKLGLNPYGHKQREGDFRTPEGKYELVARNPRSEFFLSIKISYPNREDAAVANEAGFPPGGLIMIHGQPNVPKRSPEHYATRDWTDGCIALSNADMVDVWMRTTVGIPIEIRP